MTRDRSKDPKTIQMFTLPKNSPFLSGVEQRPIITYGIDSIMERGRPRPMFGQLWYIRHLKGAVVSILPVPTRSAIAEILFGVRVENTRIPP